MDKAITTLEELDSPRYKEGAKYNVVERSLRASLEREQNALEQIGRIREAFSALLGCGSPCPHRPGCWECLENAINGPNIIESTLGPDSGVDQAMVDDYVAQFSREGKGC